MAPGYSGGRAAGGRVQCRLPAPGRVARARRLTGWFVSCLMPTARGSRRSAQRCGLSSGRLIFAGTWDRQEADGWPERIRLAVTFVMGMVTELEEHADLGVRYRTDPPK